jgi:hypothetical protein
MKMKLSDVIKVWDILHTQNIGTLGYCDLEKAIENIVGIENDLPITHPQKVINGNYPHLAGAKS